MKAAGLEFCYPAVSAASEQTSVRHSFGLALAAKLMPRAGCLLLCNESSAFTNEREGSEIARQIIRALTEAGIRTIFVTHLYDLAESLCAGRDPATLFLRAERQPDGRRTFRLPPGEPLPTSYGQDLYQSLFGTADHAAPV